MPSYNYKAINELGRKVRGSIMADNEVDLENRLKQMDLDLIDFKTEKDGEGFFELKLTSGKVKMKDLIMMCLHVEQLDRAGVPVHEALSDVRDSTDSPILKDVLADVYEQVRSGVVLSKALAKHPTIFNDVFVGLIAAGEETGNLSESFNQIADYLKWTNDLKRKVKKAVRYPIALLLLMIIVISILMIFVVPKLIDFITSQGFDIPAHTQALIWTSRVFENYWFIVLGFPGFALMMLFSLYRLSESFAYIIDDIILHLPIIGPTVRKINLARFTHFFSVMFKSGIDIITSLNSARNVVSNKVLRHSIGTVIKGVTDGSSLTQSLQKSNQFPNLVVRMFKVGEDSGNMNETLENVNFFYSREVNDSVDSMVGFIQPALTLFMGVLVFWVISAVFGPLYQSFSKMQF
jgi:type IV pilus assembly protein PilC